MLFSKLGLELVNRWLIVTPLFFQWKTATGLQEGASGLQQMSWATSYKLEKESNPLRLITGRGHTRSRVTSLWDREKATASYWISRDRAWNLSCWLQAFTLQEQCLLLWGGYRPSRGAGRRTSEGYKYPLRMALSTAVSPADGHGSFTPAWLFTQVQGSWKATAWGLKEKRQRLGWPGCCCFPGGMNRPKSFHLSLPHFPICLMEMVLFILLFFFFSSNKVVRFPLKEISPR